MTYTREQVLLALALQREADVAAVVALTHHGPHACEMDETVDEAVAAIRATPLVALPEPVEPSIKVHPGTCACFYCCEEDGP